MRLKFLTSDFSDKSVFGEERKKLANYKLKQSLDKIIIFSEKYK